MWSRLGYFHVCLLLSNIKLVINNDTDYDHNKNIKENSIFSNVIKNISRVNNVLQELIQNYEHLQKIYKAQSFETDISSESEIDEVFRDAQKRNRKSKRSKSNETRKDILLTTKKAFPGTQMMISEDEIDEDVTEKSSQSEIELPPIEKLEAAVTKSTEDLKITSYSTETEESNESIVEMKETTERDHKHSDEIKIPDNVFYDNVIKNLAKTTTTTTVKPNQIQPRNKKQRNIRKEIFRISEEESVEIDVIGTKKVNDLLSTIKYKEILPTTKNAIHESAKNVQQIVYLETFDKDNIWTEIVGKKPINLRTYQDTPSKRGNVDISSRSNSGRKKTAVVIFTKSKDDDLAKKNSESQMDDDKDIEKEVFNTRILRDAYGDSCLKVVVKKCYKALKTVSKNVCRFHKCKSDLKETFLKYSKSGCIEQFRPSENNNNLDTEDLTARRVLSLESCYPFLHPLTPSKNDSLSPLRRTDLQLNILRDSYEKACQKASASRCEEACKSAYVATCAAYTCKKTQTKAYKKECKRQCKVSYRSKKEKKRSSSSGSDSSDDSSASESSS